MGSAKIHNTRKDNYLTKLRKGQSKQTVLWTVPIFVIAHTPAHLEVLEFPMGGAYRDILARFKTTQRKQNLASALGILKQN